MKFYMLMTVKTHPTGVDVSWHRRICFFQEQAFKEAKRMGEDTCVIELTESKTWNAQQIMEEEKNDQMH